MPGHGKGWLRIAIDDWIETKARPAFEGWVGERSEAIEKSLQSVYAKTISRVLDPLDLPPEAREVLEEILFPSGQVGAIGLTAFGAQLGMSAASSLLAPIMRIINYSMDKLIKSARVDPATAIRMGWRAPSSVAMLDKHMDQLGWANDLQSLWKEMVQPRPNEGDLMSMWKRGTLSEIFLVEELRSRGWGEDDIPRIQELSNVIPGIGDLISMAVREAWRDDIAERFEYDADFPSEVVEPAAKQGLSAEWVKRYWRAHWVLPSIGQGFGMLHRLRPGTTDNPFTMDDLQTLLRISDIPAFFRQRLTEIAYTPLTRVDVRRMFGMAVLDRDGVYQAYLDGGYNEKNAELMTEFTIKFETQEQRDLTRSVIVSAYERQVMGHDEARQSIIDIGYSEENANLFLAIADTKIAERRQKDRLARAEFLYIEGEINETGVYAELGDLNLPAEQAAELIVMWEIAKQKKIALATKSELEDLYKRDIIDRDKFSNGLDKRRYDKETIGWYTERLDMRVAEDAAKDMERAQKEQERIEKAEFASIYQRTKAAMDVEIAAIKLQIADIKLAVNYMTVAADIGTAKTTILELKADIAAWQLAKAEIRMEFTEGPVTEE